MKNSRQIKKLNPAISPALAREMKISLMAIETMRIKPEAIARDEVIRRNLTPCQPMNGVLPKGKKLAMDADNLNDALNFSIQENVNFAFEQGYAFPGFSVLANWAQIPEFRKPAEIIAREMTRKWIKITATGEEDKSDKIKKIEKEFLRLNVKAKFRELIELDGFFGRSQLYIDTGESFDGDTKELAMELTETKEKVAIGSLKRLVVVEPIWSYPNRYNASNPLDPTFYKPQSWFVMGTEIHSSRLLTIITREVPDILKPAYAFSGLSLSQMMKPYVDNWLRTRQSVSDLIHSFTVWVLKTNMAQILNGGAADSFFARLQIFNDARDNHGVMAVDKDTEEFTNTTASLGSLDKLQAQAQEQQCAPSGIPLAYLTGITPTGLNASSEGEISIFQDSIHSMQEIITPQVSKVLNIAQLSLFGEIDPEIGFEWIPLKTMTEEQKAAIRKTEADTDNVYVDMQALSPEEVRTKIANQKESPYAALDLSQEILPPDQEEIPGQETDENGNPIAAPNQLQQEEMKHA